MTALDVQQPRADAPRAGPLTPGDLAELLGAFNDVTGRLQGTHERLQREVEALKAELSAANEQLARSRRLAALGEMAAGIAHEVRNPLSSIGLYARLLEQDLADRPQLRATAARIGAAVHGLNAIVGDVLNFARELRVRPRWEAASQLLTQALDACAGDAPPGALVTRADHGRGADAYCDAALAHTALINVVRNAYQAMAECRGADGHRLVVDARVGHGAGGDCVLSVADSGPGVDGDVIDRMFNPFFTTRAAGTGLGLAIVHRIMDAHGGRVSARNGPGGGAVFELSFPAPGCLAAAMDRGPASGRVACGDAPGQEIGS